LDVSKDISFSYYPTPPEGVSMTECYTIQEVKGDDKVFEDLSYSKEGVFSSITFILTFLLAIPALVITSRALNCFTEKWKMFFLILGVISFILSILNLAVSNGKPKKSSIIILKIIVVCFLLVFLIFPFIRPRQPGIDFDQGEVNAAGVPISPMQKRSSKKHKKDLKNSSSSSYLIESSFRGKTNTETTEDNENSEIRQTPVSPTSNSLNKVAIDGKYGENSGKERQNRQNEMEQREASFLSPVFINPSVKAATGEEDGSDMEEEEAYGSEIEDEDEVIKKKYLSRAKLWLMLLRGNGLLLLLTVIVIVMLSAYWEPSRLFDIKALAWIWLILVVILYIIAVIIALKRHSSMALLRARRISFRPSEPLEPNNNVNSWTMPADPMKRFSLSETSAYDDIGNVSNYSQSIKNYKKKKCSKRFL